MSNTAQDGQSPTLFAVITGVVVMVALMVSGFGFLLSIVAGLVTISIVFMWRKKAAPVQELPRSQIDPAPAAAPIAPKKEAPAGEAQAFPDLRLVGAAAAKPVAQKAPVVASSQMPGEAELASRKGAWRYEAAPLEEPAPVAEIAPIEAAIASSQLGGEVELASRKGSWTYSG